MFSGADLGILRARREISSAPWPPSVILYSRGLGARIRAPDVGGVSMGVSRAKPMKSL